MCVCHLEYQNALGSTGYCLSTVFTHGNFLCPKDKHIWHREGCLAWNSAWQGMQNSQECLLLSYQQEPVILKATYNGLKTLLEKHCEFYNSQNLTTRRGTISDYRKLTLSQVWWPYSTRLKSVYYKCIRLSVPILPHSQHLHALRGSWLRGGDGDWNQTKHNKHWR